MTLDEYLLALGEDTIAAARETGRMVEQQVPAYTATPALAAPLDGTCNPEGT